MEPILVVDDKADILSILKEEFDSQDIESSEVDNTSDAVELLKTKQFSCLFLDIVLGNTSSEKIVEFLKGPENTLNSNLPVIVMSGYVDPAFVERVKTKVYKVIEKPFEEGLIQRIIEDLSVQEQPQIEEVQNDNEEADPMDFL